MSVQTDPPKVSRVTTVANVSTSEQHAAERADSQQPVPQTRPDPATQPPRPRPKMVPEHRRHSPPTPLATHHAGRAGQLPVRPPQRRVPTRIVTTEEARRLFGPIAVTDPPEGIGPGTPPKGGMKIR